MVTRLVCPHAPVLVSCGRIVAQFRASGERGTRAPVPVGLVYEVKVSYYWNALISLAWIPFVMGHAIWAWRIDETLSTYWMLCVCALCICYGVQWVLTNRTAAKRDSDRN